MLPSDTGTKPNPEEGQKGRIVIKTGKILQSPWTHLAGLTARVVLRFVVPSSEGLPRIHVEKQAKL
jgi:hypothetical protein